MLYATPFARAIEWLKPGATGRDIVNLLDGKANRTTALDWRSGRRAPPQWAIDRLRQRIVACAVDGIDAIGLAEPGVGRQANAIHIRRYNARRA